MNPPLSPKQQAVVELVATGLSNDEIAARLKISTGAVKRRLEIIFARLGVSSRIAVAAWHWKIDLATGGHLATSQVTKTPRRRRGRIQQ
jgi:DNA-binding NarL/FixJ family response regulator